MEGKQRRLNRQLIKTNQKYNISTLSPPCWLRKKCGFTTVSFKSDWSFAFSVKAFWPLQPTKPSDLMKKRRRENGEWEEGGHPTDGGGHHCFCGLLPQLCPSTSRLSVLSPATPQGVSSAHRPRPSSWILPLPTTSLTPAQATADCFTHSLTNIYWVPTMCSINAGF